MQILSDASAAAGGDGGFKAFTGFGKYKVKQPVVLESEFEKAMLTKQAEQAEKELAERAAAVALAVSEPDLPGDEDDDMPGSEEEEVLADQFPGRCDRCHAVKVWVWFIQWVWCLW